MVEEHKDEVWRPGEDVSHLANMTDEQKTERRVEIEELFNNPRDSLVEPEQGFGG
jgi:hypothetical protein